MEIKQLQYFVTSADLGSFKKAAEALYTTQPHVSKTIKALEDELGLALFDRHPAGVTVTDAGRQVYAHASEVLLQCGRIAQLENSGPCEPLHLAAAPSGYLTDLTAAFCSQWQGEPLSLRYQESDPAGIIHQLHRHEAGLGLLPLLRRKLTGFYQLVNKKRLCLEELAACPPYLFVGPSHPLAHAPSVDVSTLRTLPLLPPPDGLFPPGAFAGPSLGSGANHHISTNSPLLSRRLIESGAACSLGSRWSYPADSSLRAIPVTRSETEICLCALRHRREDLSPAEQAFLEFVRKTVQEEC